MKLPSWLDPYTEPARLRAIWAAVVALLGTLGVVINTDLNGVVEAVIVVVATLVPLLQGESTRAVVSPARGDHDLAA